MMKIERTIFHRTCKSLLLVVNTLALLGAAATAQTKNTVVGAGSGKSANTQTSSPAVKASQAENPKAPPATNNQRNSQQKQIIFRELKKAFDEEDYLAIRVLVKLAAAYPLTLKEWSFVRRAIHQRPRAGADLIFKWDALRPQRSEQNTREGRINMLMVQADEAMLSDNFDKAFRYNQLLAKLIKSEIQAGQRDNYYLYGTAIHHMARALYGAGRYRESLQVYTWISKDYFKYRQTLFEKMWAAFRAGRTDLALGAIASQQSSYFSDFLEPEAYLIQVYLFKKLCRDEELKQSRDLIRALRRKIDPAKGNFLLEDWVKADVEVYNLYLLTQLTVKDSDEYAARKRLEQSRILQSLKKRFDSERARLFKQMDMVLGYSGLSVAMDRSIVNTDFTPDRNKMLRSNREFWPADSAEDWLDEQGGHVFIGESKCLDQKSN